MLSDLTKPSAERAGKYLSQSPSWYLWALGVTVLSLVVVLSIWTATSSKDEPAVEELPRTFGWPVDTATNTLSETRVEELVYDDSTVGFRLAQDGYLIEVKIYSDVVADSDINTLSFLTRYAMEGIDGTDSAEGIAKVINEYLAENSSIKVEVISVQFMEKVDLPPNTLASSS